jgi:hypothetical protein
MATIDGVFLKSSMVNMNTFKGGNVREHGMSCGLLMTLFHKISRIRHPKQVCSNGRN